MWLANYNIDHYSFTICDILGKVSGVDYQRFLFVKLGFEQANIKDISNYRNRHARTSRGVVRARCSKTLKTETALAEHITFILLLTAHSFCFVSFSSFRGMLSTISSFQTKQTHQRILVNFFPNISHDDGHMTHLSCKM